MEVELITGEELAKLAKELVVQPPEIIAQMEKLMGEYKEMSDKLNGTGRRSGSHVSGKLETALARLVLSRVGD